MQGIASHRTRLGSGRGGIKLLGPRCQIGPCSPCVLEEVTSLPERGKGSMERERFTQTTLRTKNSFVSDVMSCSMFPGNFPDRKLLSTENTALAIGAPGFSWYLVHFDGPRIKCANEFLGTQRPSTRGTGFSICCLKPAEGLALLRAAPGRTAFRREATCSGFCHELPNLE